MKYWVNRYIGYIVISFTLLLLTFLYIFYAYLRNDLKLEQSLIWFFYAKYLWLIIILAVIFIFVGYIFVSKTLKPFHDIAKTTQKILARSAASNLLHPGEELDQSHLAGAMNQLAENIEKQLQLIEQNEIRLRGVLENMSNGLLLVSKDRRIVLVNQATEEFLNYSTKDLIGKRHVEATRNTEMSDMIEECFHTREKIKKEIKLYYPREKILQVNFAPMKNETNELLGVVVILNDITDIKKLEKVRKDFVANVSHELKTPLTSIKGFTETLLDGAYEDKVTSLNFLNIIKTESDRLLQIVNDLLDLSIIENNKIELDKETFKLKSLIELIVNSLETQIKSQQVNIQINLADDFMITADKSRFAQILINLMNNAISHIPKNGDIIIGAETKEDYQQVYVQDTGIGILKENLDRIFERFYRVDKARTRGAGGTGLGLAIVKHLVEVHHGRIYVESELGKGTTFIIQIPK